VIHGPATANYDVDLEPIVITDWSHATVDALYSYAQTRGPPKMDTALINGKGTYNGTGGERYQVMFEAGKKYRMRFVNAAVDSYFKLSLDGHKMTVIAMDFVSVEPFEIDVLDFTMGQRYDVIIEANQEVSSYWFRAIPQAACSNNANSDDIRGIVRYSGSNDYCLGSQSEGCLYGCGLLPPQAAYEALRPTPGPPGTQPCRQR
jgi:FtsP/CotA-like multicopper oxidase with cupredoxin domain